MNNAFKLAPHEWAQLRALIDEAMTQPPADRLAWVDRLDDTRHGALKPRLQNLLAHAPDAIASTPGTLERLLDTLPKVETDQFAPRPGSAAAPAEHIGPYRLIRELGSGGMASVWLAERTDMLQRRQVALKLPHGAWKRSGLAERMAREREILATLEHPNVARLYDAGVAEDGQLFMALEYVEGERIDAWCERQALDVPARLRLFLQVARAVAYAHAQLVVHRDLKPSNVLVTADGQAKLLDFGIAKLIDQGTTVETELTQQSGRALTPDYAAPEQILGKPLGTAADVYALGVLLFELLAGQRPYRLKRDTRAALEEAILHAEVPRPSSVAPQARRKAVRGDLDTIVLKALKREPVERYSTAASLVDDIQRHLDHRPVLARPDGVGYRLRVALRRNRLAVVAGGATLAALLAGTALALWQAQLAREQRDAAVAERERADRQAASAQLARRIAEGQASVSDFLLTDARQQVPHAQAVKQIELAVTMVRKQFRHDPEVRADLLADAGNRLRWIGEDARARELWAEAEALVREANRHVSVARVLCMRARERAIAGQIEEARQLVIEGHAALRRVSEQAQLPPSGCLLDEAVVERRAGNPLRALALGEQALALERAAGRAETDLAATLLHEIGRARLELGHFAAAADSARASLKTQEQIGRDVGSNRQWSWYLLAMARREGGQTAQALRDFAGDGQFDESGEGLTPMRRVPIAQAFLVQGRAREGLDLLRTIVTALADDVPEVERAIVRVHVARAQLALGDLAAALATLDGVAPVLVPTLGTPAFAAYRYLIVRAEWAMRTGHMHEATALLARARDVLEAEPRPGDPPSLEGPWRTLHRAQAELELVQRSLPKAMESVRQALELSERTAIDRRASLYVGEDLLLRATVRAAASNVNGAYEDAQNARAHILASGGPQHPLLAQADRLVAAKPRNPN